MSCRGAPQDFSGRVMRDRAYSSLRTATLVSTCDSSAANEPQTFRWRALVQGGVVPQILGRISLSGRGVFQLNFEAYAYSIDTLETVILNATYYFGKSATELKSVQDAFVRDQTQDRWAVVPDGLSEIILALERRPFEIQEAVVSMTVSLPLDAQIALIPV